MLVDLALLRPVAEGVAVGDDANDLVGGEEAVLNALLEGVGVDRLAEVVDVGLILRFPRRGGEPEVGGFGEVVDDFAPGGILVDTAAMTLVDDHEIEEIARELAVDLLPLLRPGDSLVEAEVDFEISLDLAVGDLVHHVAERGEILLDGLVHQDIAVGEKEDALLALGLPEAPDDLEGRVGLAGAGGHDQEEALLALGDGFDGAVDGDALVVAGALPVPSVW